MTTCPNRPRRLFVSQPHEYGNQYFWWDRTWWVVRGTCLHCGYADESLLTDHQLLSRFGLSRIPRKTNEARAGIVYRAEELR